jgi:hypothetical protein
LVHCGLDGWRDAGSELTDDYDDGVRALMTA